MILRLSKMHRRYLGASEAGATGISLRSLQGVKRGIGILRVRFPHRKGWLPAVSESWLSSGNGGFKRRQQVFKPDVSIPKYCWLSKLTVQVFA